MEPFRTLSHLFCELLKTKQFKVCLIFFILQVGYFFIFNNLETQDKRGLYYYTQAKIFHKILPDFQIYVRFLDKNKKEDQGYYSAKDYYNYAYPNGELSSYSKYVLDMFKKDVLESFRFFIFGVGFYFLLRFIFYRDLLGKYIKGAKLISVNRLIQILKSEGRARFKIGPVPLPIERESDHVLYIGPEGCGKKIDMMRNIKTAIFNDFPCIIFDFNGDMISHFYREHTDHIFNIADPKRKGVKSSVDSC